MMILRWSVCLVGVYIAGVSICCGADDLLREDFDTLAVEGVAGQEGWKDNSKQGTAVVVSGDSLSQPNHLELSEGGAVHHEIGTTVDAGAKLALEFGIKRKALTAGRNLQVSLRGKEGQALLFLNIRGSGRALDAGPNGEALTELSFTEDLPKEQWLRVKMECLPSESQVRIRIVSEDGVVYLDERLPFPIESPSRLIVGSTPSTPLEESWAVDNIVVHQSL